MVGPCLRPLVKIIGLMNVVLSKRIASALVIEWLVLESLVSIGSAFSFNVVHLPRRGASSFLCSHFDSSTDIFSPKANHPTTFENDPAFLYKALNDDAVRRSLYVGSRTRLGSAHVAFFEELILRGEESGPVSPAKIGRALALRECVDAKELFESLEFYLRIRRRIRRPVVVDLACGHGLCGLLFAALEKSVKAVVLVDSRKPQSFQPILESFAEVAPWVVDKIHFLEKNLYSVPSSKGDQTLAVLNTAASSSTHQGGAFADEQFTQSEAQDYLELPSELQSEQCGFVAIHACGRATDRCLTIAAAVQGPIAAMPCCYTGCGLSAPYGLRRMLGKGLAADIDRSYLMERRGYSVDFSAIPKCVTPLNRILVAVPRGR